MLNQQTIEKLYTMRMRGMADAFTQQQEDPQTTQLSFEERFALLVDQQWNWRQNRALERRLREARLQGPACIEDIDFRAARGLDKQVVRSLMQDSDWVRRHQHIFLVGPTGIGKTFLARALWTEGLPRRIHRLLRYYCAAVSGTGTGSGGRHLCQAATDAGTSRSADRR
jgi:DNA replication protein DnaC